jgi:hypothetical protein
MLEDFQLSSVDGEPVYIDSQGRSMSVSDYNNAAASQGSQQVASTVSQEVASNLGGGAGTAGIAGLQTTGGGASTAGIAGLQDTDAGDNRAFIEQTYLNEVGRKGETEGVDYWTNLLNSGAITRDQLSAAFSGTEEGKQFDLRNAGKTDVVTTPVDQALMDYLESKYMSEFGRKADAEGLKNWYDVIKRGDLTKEQVAYVFSKEAEGLKYDLQNLAAGKLDLGYVSPELLQRYNDLTGAFQSKLYRAGTADELAKYLANPGDYAKLLGDTDEAFVQKTYRDVLKFAPDAKGLQYWMGQLASGVLKREDLAKALTATQKQIVREQDIAKNRVVFNPFTSTVYSNLAMSDRASDFGNFPIIRGTRTTETGAVVPTVRLNLQQRPSASLGIRSFAPVAMSSYAYDPSSKSLFGGDRLFGGTGMTGGTSYNIFGTPTTVQTVQTTGGGAQGAGGETEVVMAANGGMIMSDPVMRRAMFRAGGPVSSVGTGITSNVATPEENAKALQTMFAPGFRRGGPVQHFYNGGEAKDVLQIGDPSIEGPSDVIPIEAPASVEEPSTSTREPYVPKTPAGRAIRDFFYPSQKAQEKIDRAMEEKARADAVEEARRRNPVPSVFSEVTDAEREAARQRQQRAVDQASGVTAARDIAAREIREREELDMYRQAEEDERLYRGATAAAARDTAPARTDGGTAREPIKNQTYLNLEKLKADREANKEKRRENQLLALMQAGFAAAAGRSRNALANIAAGGISGVQTLAELEKDRRAEDRALRREILEVELTQERMREAAAERRAAREQTAAERERTMLQTVSANINNRLGNIRSDILSARTKLTPGIPEDQKREIEIEIANLSAQARAEQDRLDQLYDRLGIGKPRTAGQDFEGFSWRVKK